MENNWRGDADAFEKTAETKSLADVGAPQSAGASATGAIVEAATENTEKASVVTVG